MKKIAIIGLGYVGLPLAVAFSKHHQVVGFDKNNSRIKQLKLYQDITQEISKQELIAATRLTFTTSAKEISDANIYIITVPTPVDGYKRPDLGPLLSASEEIGTYLKKGDIVIYESTVYPGATEEDCVPILEKYSKLQFNKDFFVGYSPERINPGDKTHKVADICKVTSGSTPEIANEIDDLYRQIIKVGTFKAASIKVAEAAKVIENTQRDLNIALMNELSQIFSRMGIDTTEVLQAAKTKWNFLPFQPGLVGGHCIGVDPYYLTHKAQELGFDPKLILSGRQVNENMGNYVTQMLVQRMIRSQSPGKPSKVLILGLSFKENCPDIRNTRVIDIVNELQKLGIHVDVTDPWVDPDTALKEHGLILHQEPKNLEYDGIILAVAHTKFQELGAKAIRGYGRPEHVFFDLKGLFQKADSDLRL